MIEGVIFVVYPFLFVRPHNEHLLNKLVSEFSMRRQERFLQGLFQPLIRVYFSTRIILYFEKQILRDTKRPAMSKVQWCHRIKELDESPKKGRERHLVNIDGANRGCWRETRETIWHLKIMFIIEFNLSLS